MFVFTAVLAAIFPAPAVCAQRPAPTPQVIAVTGDVEGAHDPSIIKEGSTWYLFGTATEPKRDGELPVRCSQDLHHWNRCGYVLPGVPQWIQKESPETKELWAPDISYFDGQYHLYYAFSAFGKNTSGIALLTNETLDPKAPQFHWVDQGLVLQSKTDDEFNAIDPNLILDENGASMARVWQFLERNQDAKAGSQDR